MRELRPCRKCGRKPVFVPYEESTDGNHDKPAKVVCPCGNRHILTWEEFSHAMHGVPPEKRGRGYMSRAEIEAAGDAAADAWNVEQGDAPATNDERGRVAAELRELSACAVTSDSADEVLASVLRIGRSDFLDELLARLAELIEPGEGQIEPDSSTGADRGTRVDRDALMALADDLDARATELLKVNDLDQSRQRRSARRAHAMDLMAACSRIREALGEAV